jgi:phosphonate transport system ATP-binding protein
VIQVRELSKRYPSGTVGLDGVTLDVEAGEFVALIGSSGAGKSTFLRCLNGLVIPTAGTVRIDGRPVTGASRQGLRSVRARVGFVFQQFNLLKRLSVLDNVLVGTLSRVDLWRSLLGRFRAGDLERARRTLKRVGLDGVEGQRADTLSGGQQQRVAIARALVQEPLVLLADEPMSSLDPALSRSVMELLRDINREDGLTVIASLHVLDLAITYGDRIVGLRAGRVVHDGSAAGLTPSAAEAIFDRERSGDGGGERP